MYNVCRTNIPTAGNTSGVSLVGTYTGIECIRYKVCRASFPLTGILAQDVSVRCFSLYPEFRLLSLPRNIPNGRNTSGTFIFGVATFSRSLPCPTAESTSEMSSFNVYM